MRALYPLFACSLLVVACGGQDGASGAGDAGVETLVIEPADATLVVVDGMVVEQAFTVTKRHADGSTEDVTAEASFTIDRPQLGSFDGTSLQAAGRAAGRGEVAATVDGEFGTAAVTVRVEQTRIVDGAPADARTLFDNATDDPAMAPTIVYPAAGSVMPLNLGDFEVHWTSAGALDLYELRLATEFLDLRAYTTGAPGAAAWLSVLTEEWATIAASAAGESFQVAVRGLSTANPTTAGRSTSVEVALSSQNIEGGLYYWAAASATGATPEGIYRHDMGRPGEAAEEFYTPPQLPPDVPANQRCVACHVLSRDGGTMAITLAGGGGPGWILDVATRTPIVGAAQALRWNFATFEPGAERIVTSSEGVLTLRDVAGTAVSTVEGVARATHPDFSPNGDAIVFVEVADAATFTNDWTFTGGRIMTASFDPATAAFGAPTPLVDAEAQNLYYPSWSPDGQWVAFNKSNEDAYDDASAELWVVKADGSVPPIKLEAPNEAPGLTNSWVRWAPFEQVYGEGEAAEPLFWLTFSSKRAFGVRLGEGRPQIWMAPFFPARAASGAVSAPAFRLPFQNIETSNHIAQWTERVVPIE